MLPAYQKWSIFAGNGEKIRLLLIEEFIFIQVYSTENSSAFTELTDDDFNTSGMDLDTG